MDTVTGMYERVKPNRRDAIKLVKALRMGDLTAVHVPDVDDEAMHDLVRAWDAAKRDLRKARAYDGHQYCCNQPAHISLSKPSNVLAAPPTVDSVQPANSSAPLKLVPAT